MMWKSIAGAAAMGLLLVGPAKAAQQGPNLYEQAESAGSYKRFLSAVNAAGLADALKGDDSWTVLAPTDDAFASLPEGTVERLLKPENKDELVGVLSYHLIPGRNFASTWANEEITVETKGGQKLMIDGKGSPFMVGAAEIVTKNIPADNGIIHGINGVLIPPSS
jgi:uncharacterized surface protein with fasciclin (FAS1) repeats